MDRYNHALRSCRSALAAFNNRQHGQPAGPDAAQNVFAVRGQAVNRYQQQQQQQRGRSHRRNANRRGRGGHGKQDDLRFHLDKKKNPVANPRNNFKPRREVPSHGVKYLSPQTK